MAMMIISVIFVMIVERYVNRCDTKAVEGKPLEDVGKKKKNHFSQKEMGFQKNST